MMTLIVLRSKKWKSHMLMIDAIAYEAMQRHEHKSKERRIIPLPVRKLKGGDDE